MLLKDMLRKTANEGFEHQSQISNSLNELDAKLGLYKTAAGKAATAADRAGDTKTANKRFSGIVKATKKEFANTAKKAAEKTQTEDTSGPVTATGYAYNRRDQRIVWTREFPNEQAARAWANQKNATIVDIKKAAVKQGVAEYTQLSELSKDTLRSYVPRRLNRAKDEISKDPAKRNIAKARRATQQDVPRAMTKLKDPNYGMQGKILSPGTRVKLRHKGKIVLGNIVRYHEGIGGDSPAYVVDISEYESLIVPVSKVQKYVAEGEKKGLYYYVNKRKKAGTSRPASSPKAPTAQDWKNAAKTAKKESVAEVSEVTLPGKSKLSGATAAPAPNPALKNILLRHMDEVKIFVKYGEIDQTGPMFQDLYEYFANEIPEPVRRDPLRLERRIGNMIAPYAKFYTSTNRMNEESVAEGNIWHGTDSGSEESYYTDHSFEEAIQYIKGAYPFNKTYRVYRAEPGFRALFNPTHFLKGLSHTEKVDSGLNQLQLKRNPMMSGSEQRSYSIGWSWSVAENTSTGIAVLYYQDRGMASDEVIIAAKDKQQLAGAVGVFRDAGVLPDPSEMAARRAQKAAGRTAIAQKKGLAVGVKFSERPDDGSNMYKITAIAPSGKVKAVNLDTGQVRLWSPGSISKGMLLTGLYPDEFDEPRQGVAEGSIRIPVTELSVNRNATVHKWQLRNDQNFKLSDEVPSIILKDVTVAIDEQAYEQERSLFAFLQGERTNDIPEGLTEFSIAYRRNGVYPFIDKRTGEPIERVDYVKFDEQGKVTGYKQGVTESGDDLPNFRKSLGNAVRGRVSQIHANTAIATAQGVFKWKAGDLVYSPKTGNTYQITGTAVSKTAGPIYFYTRDSGDPEWPEKGTFSINRGAHENLKKVSSESNSGKTVPVSEDVENIMSALINKLVINEAVQNFKR